MPPDSPRFWVTSALFPCVHLQNLTLPCWLTVSYSLLNQCPRMEFKKNGLGLEGIGGWGGGCNLNIVIAKGGTIFVCNYFWGKLSFDTPHFSDSPPPPLPREVINDRSLNYLMKMSNRKRRRWHFWDPIFKNFLWEHALTLPQVWGDFGALPLCAPLKSGATLLTTVIL